MGLGVVQGDSLVSRLRNDPTFLAPGEYDIGDGLDVPVVELRYRTSRPCLEIHLSQSAATPGRWAASHDGFVLGIWIAQAEFGCRQQCNRNTGGSH